MSKKYTAQEMREMALVEESYGWNVVAEMLRQAADDLERETREKKYEYAERFTNNDVCSRHYETVKGLAVNIEIDPESSIVRRSVGEWEEVKE